MAEFSHYIILYNQFTNTYLTLLPKELQDLLTGYYYGPLELIYYHHEKDRSVLVIRKFANNKLDSSINITISVTNLVEEYEKNHNDGIFPTIDGETTVNWKRKYVEIGQTSTYARPKIYLHGYIAKLFWQKLKYLANTLTKNYNLGVSDDAIRNVLTDVVF